MKKIDTKSVARNVSTVLLVQIVSTIISFVIGFIVPKFISEITYSRWQVYMLYVNYSALFHFGVYDGFVLRYSQYDYDELDKRLVRSQFYFVNFILDVIGAVLLIIIGIVSRAEFYIVLLIVIGIILKNVFRYSSYTFQTTNAINDYSISLLIERVGYVLLVVLFLILKVDNYIVYCIADIMGNVVAVIYGIIRRPQLFVGHLLNFKTMLREYWKNLSVGIFVTIATFSFSFLITGAKMIVQWHWDELTFGQMSFSISVMNTFLTFITAASVVLLPSLKRIDRDKLPSIYLKMRSILSIVLFVGIGFYFPVAWILQKWLPNYSTGILYAGIILPSVIFSSKVNLLTNNYLKYYFKEKLLLLINIGTMVLGACLFAVAAYVFNNILLMLYLMDILCMLNSVITEIVVSKLINVKLVFKIIEEIVLGVSFVVLLQLVSTWVAFGIYFAIIIVYLTIHWKSLTELFKTVRNKIKKRDKNMYTQFDTIKSNISDDDIKRYKQIILQILVDFDSFLQQHQIKYSLAFGTMIGAVRHKGFIPWDDDIDIILSQEQYQKLLTVIDEFNSDDYKVVLPCSDDCTSFARAIKIYYRKATIKEYGIECYTGPYIDVFTTIDVKHKRSLSYYRFLCTAYDIKNGHVNLKNPNTKSVKTIAFLAKFVSKRSLKKKILKYYKKKTNSEYCVASFGSLYQYKKTYFEEFIEADFEGYKFPISVYYDQMLTTVYGDYMQLPSKDQRNPHHLKQLIFGENFEDKNRELIK